VGVSLVLVSLVSTFEPTHHTYLWLYRTLCFVLLPVYAAMALLGQSSPTVLLLPCTTFPFLSTLLCDSRPEKLAMALSSSLFMLLGQGDIFGPVVSLALHGFSFALQHHTPPGLWAVLTRRYNDVQLGVLLGCVPSMAILLVRTQASGAIWGAPMRPHRPAAGMAAYGLHLAAGCVMWKSDVFDAVAGLLRNTLLGTHFESPEYEEPHRRAQKAKAAKGVILLFVVCLFVHRVLIEELTEGCLMLLLGSLMCVFNPGYGALMRAYHLGVFLSFPASCLMASTSMVTLWELCFTVPVISAVLCDSLGQSLAIVLWSTGWAVLLEPEDVALLRAVPAAGMFSWLLQTVQFVVIQMLMKQSAAERAKILMEMKDVEQAKSVMVQAIAVSQKAEHAKHTELAAEMQHLLSRVEKNITFIKNAKSLNDSDDSEVAS